jgi:hypothetical protein
MVVCGVLQAAAASSSASAGEGAGGAGAASSAGSMGAASNAGSGVVWEVSKKEPASPSGFGPAHPGISSGVGPAFHLGVRTRYMEKHLTLASTGDPAKLRSWQPACLPIEPIGTDAATIPPGHEVFQWQLQSARFEGKSVKVWVSEAAAVYLVHAPDVYRSAGQDVGGGAGVASAKRWVP